MDRVVLGHTGTAVIATRIHLQEPAGTGVRRTRVPAGLVQMEVVCLTVNDSREEGAMHSMCPKSRLKIRGRLRVEPGLV